MPSENRKAQATNGGRKGLNLREMTNIKVKINAPFSNKTKSTNRQPARKRK
jgi:hypothetical protein